VSPHVGVVIESASERTFQMRSLALSLCDVFERVPSGQPATCMRHDDNLFAAPGVNLRETRSENSGEGRAR